MDVSNLTPDLSNVLTPDTLKAIGVILSLFAAKWAIGKAWVAAKATTKTLAASLSFIGVASSVLMLTGTTSIGFGIGEIKRPEYSKIIIAYSGSGSPNHDILKRKLERRIIDQQTLTPEQYEKKWLGEGNEFMEEMLLPDEKPGAYAARGATSIGFGIGAIIVGIAAFLRKYG